MDSLALSMTWRRKTSLISPDTSMKISKLHRHLWTVIWTRQGKNCLTESTLVFWRTISSQRSSRTPISDSNSRDCSRWFRHRIKSTNLATNGLIRAWVNPYPVSCQLIAKSKITKSIVTKQAARRSTSLSWKRLPKQWVRWIKIWMI